MNWTVRVNALVRFIYLVLYSDWCQCKTKNATIFTELIEVHVRLPLLANRDVFRYRQSMPANTRRHSAFLVVERVEVRLQAVAALAGKSDVGVVVGAVLGPRTDVVLG